jgi:MFS family permease
MFDKFKHSLYSNRIQGWSEVVSNRKMKKLENNHIIIVSIATALCLIGDSMLYITLPIYWKDAGLTSIWQVGFLLSINRFVRLPANPIIGWIYKKVTLRTGLLIAVIIGSITTVGYGVVEGFIGWVILRGLWGIAWSFFRIGGLSAVVLFAEDNSRGKAMGLYNGLHRLGSLFGMLLGGILVPLFGFNIISILFGIVSVAGLPIILFRLKEQPISSETVPKKSTNKGFFKNDIGSTITIMFSGFFIAMLIQGILTATLSSLIEYHFGEKPSLLGIVISVTALSGSIQSARWVWEPFLGTKVGIWSDGKRGRIPLYIGFLALSSILFGMLSLHLAIFVWLFIILLVMAASTAITTLTDAIASDVARETNAISFLTIYSIVQDLGAAIGPFTGYYFIEKVNGYYYLYWGSSIVLLLLMLAWCSIFLYKKLTSNQVIHSDGLGK